MCRQDYLNNEKDSEGLLEDSDIRNINVEVGGGPVLMVLGTEISSLLALFDVRVQARPWL